MSVGKEMGVAWSQAVKDNHKENKLFTAGVKAFHPEARQEPDMHKFETDIRRFERRMKQLLDTESVTEEVKVKTLMGLTRGTARMLLDQKYEEGNRSVDGMLRALRVQYGYQDTPAH